MDKFATIRSYKDHEVPDVINALLGDDRVTSSFLQLIFPKAYAFIPFKNFFIRRFLSYKLRSIDNIESYQKIFENLVEKVIDQSIASFRCNGLEQLDKNYRYLFISNHRDITLDSALLNYALYKAGHKTFNIAVGDNLMNTKWVADLMRLNKSFIIQRSGATKKDIYKGLSLASEYIYELINNNESVWIAQKQGRAKDGIDSTDSALLKMIHLHKRKELSISEYFNELKVVPVAVSYEFDPNDINKAIECVKTNQGIDYIKSSNEDISSIAKGITDMKGDVSINVGSPLNFVSDDTDQISDQITKSIRNLYEPHSTNYAAYMKSKNEILDHSFSDSKINDSIDYLESRVKLLTELEKEELYSQYYQCLIKKWADKPPINIR